MDSPLQFEKADFTTPPAGAVACEACRQAITDAYYQVAGQTFCERCKTEAELHRASGTGIGRLVRATLYGTGAGALGAGLWYGVRALTGYEVGLIAILVGLMVGGAVRKGSDGRGGWAYQALAIFLTYGSIVSTYVPAIVQAITQQAEPAAAGQPGPPPTPASAEVAPPGTAPAHFDPSPMPPGAALLGLLLGVVVIGALAFAAPFLGGFENIMGILIIGFGLYEAWKINRRVPFSIEGPFRVGSLPPVEQQ